MNLARYNACGVECIIWDLGGINSLWERYYPDCDAIIYVMDSTDSTKEMEESAKIYESVCSHEIFREREVHVPKIVFMNKLDKENECSYNTANWKRLFQQQQQNGNNDVVNIFGGSAKTGDGIRYAMEFLILAVIGQKKR